MEPTRGARIAVLSFGIVFSAILLALAVAIREPTEPQIFTFRVVLSMAAAAVAAFVPGMGRAKVGAGFRFGGSLAVFACVYAVNPPALVTGFTPFTEAMQRADTSLAAAQFDKAELFYDRARAAKPGSWLPLFGLGRVADRRGDYARAYDLWSRAFALQGGNDPEITYAIAHALEGMGKNGDANAMLEKTVALSTTDAALARDASYDIARLELLAWQREATDASSPHYARARHLFEEFLSGGQPLCWARFHLACLAAIQGRRGPHEGDARVEAWSQLSQAVDEIVAARSIKAEGHRRMMHARLSRDSGTVSPGDPAYCPDLNTLLAADGDRRSSLLTRLE